MSTTTGNAKGYVAQLVSSPTSKQVVRSKVTDLLTTKFQTSLGKEPDIVNLVMSLIQRESAFNADARGPHYGSAAVNKLLTYSAIKTKWDQGTESERANIRASAAAFGLTQVTGFYAIKGAGPSGTGELMRLRPDLAGPLMVDPGEDVRNVLLGDSNLDNQILAGLIVLEGKYKSGYVSKLVSSGVFNNKMTAAIASYLGAVGKADGLGTTPEAYANSIIRGANYQIANNGVAPNGTPLVAGGGTSGQNTANPGGPGKTAASGIKLSSAGC